VHGEGSSGRSNDNPLFQSKRQLDIDVKMWTVDLSNGWVGYGELKDGFDHPYFDKVIRSIMKRVVSERLYDRREGLSVLSGSNRIEYLVDIGTATR